MPASIDNLSRRLAASTTAEERAYYQEMIDQSPAFLQEMRSVPVELPNITFDDEMT